MDTSEVKKEYKSPVSAKCDPKENVKPDLKNPLILVATSPNIRYNVRPAPSEPELVYPAGGGTVPRLQWKSSVIVMFGQENIKRAMATKGPEGTKVIYRGDQNAGYLNYDKWFLHNQKLHNFKDEDFAEFRQALLENPTWGQGLGTPDMVDSLIWGAVGTRTDGQETPKSAVTVTAG